jgi:hypothetical protein
MRPEAFESVTTRLAVARGQESGCRVEPGLGVKAVRERREVPVGDIKIDALHAMHGKENDRRSEWLSFLHHRGNILK